MSRRKKKPSTSKLSPVEVDWERLARATADDLKHLYLLQRAIDRRSPGHPHSEKPQQRSLAEEVNAKSALRVRGHYVKPQQKKKGPKQGCVDMQRRKRARGRCQASAASGERCKIVGPLRDGVCGVHQKQGKFQRNLAHVRKKKPGRREQYRNDYLLSDHWHDFKVTYYTAHAKQCAFCQATGRIDLHHKTYARIGHEGEHDVVPLCRLHHEAVHRFHNDNPGLSLEDATDRWLRTAVPVAA